MTSLRSRASGSRATSCRASSSSSTSCRGRPPARFSSGACATSSPRSALRGERLVDLDQRLALATREVAVGPDRRDDFRLLLVLAAVRRLLVQNVGGELEV